MRRRTFAGILFTAPLAAAACSPQKATIDGSLAETYVNLEQLSDAAEVIAEAMVLSTDIDRSDGIPWTISSVKIEKVLKGQVDDTIILRQTGTVDEVAEGLSPVVEDHGRYVLYLVPYVINDEQTGEYTPVTIGVLKIQGDIAVVPETAKDLEEFPETVELSAVKDMAEESSMSDGAK